MKFAFILLILVNLHVTTFGQAGIVGNDGRNLIELRGNRVVNQLGISLGTLSNFRFVLQGRLLGYMDGNSVFDAKGNLLGYVLNNSIVDATGINVALCLATITSLTSSMEN